MSNPPLTEPGASRPTMLEPLDVICFSHLRWNFVHQRPQHLMNRFAGKGRVFFIEEAVSDGNQSSLEISEPQPNIFVCVPHCPAARTPAELDDVVLKLIDGLVEVHKPKDYITWFYTPMMLEWSRNLRPLAVIYDCMDELSGFKNAPPKLHERERQLFSLADLVFTGGQSLYEAKREQHKSIYAFPSSIDEEHFRKAKDDQEDRPEQAEIRHPRVGFVGVIDERSDLELLEAVANLLSDMSFIMVGPVVKIDESSLPRRSNIYYLGQKSYDELPAILSGWDVAMMPFALNESTRYISPTKTPEYLAAGLPVVCTPITDVVNPYGTMGLVRIASTPEQFAASITAALEEDRAERRKKAAEFLGGFSWDKTFNSMYELIADCVGKKSTQTAPARV